MIGEPEAEDKFIAKFIGKIAAALLGAHPGDCFQ